MVGSTRQVVSESGDREVDRRPKRRVLDAAYGRRVEVRTIQVVIEWNRVE